MFHKSLPSCAISSLVFAAVYAACFADVARACIVISCDCGDQDMVDGTRSTITQNIMTKQTTTKIPMTKPAMRSLNLSGGGASKSGEQAISRENTELISKIMNSPDLPAHAENGRNSIAPVALLSMKTSNDEKINLKEKTTSQEDTSTIIYRAEEAVDLFKLGGIRVEFSKVALEWILQRNWAIKLLSLHKSAALYDYLSKNHDPHNETDDMSREISKMWAADADGEYFPVSPTKCLIRGAWGKSLLFCEMKLRDYLLFVDVATRVSGPNSNVEKLHSNSSFKTPDILKRQVQVWFPDEIPDFADDEFVGQDPDGTIQAPQNPDFHGKHDPRRSEFNVYEDDGVNRFIEVGVIDSKMQNADNSNNSSQKVFKYVVNGIPKYVLAYFPEDSGILKLRTDLKSISVPARLYLNREDVSNGISNLDAKNGAMALYSLVDETLENRSSWLKKCKCCYMFFFVSCVIFCLLLILMMAHYQWANNWKNSVKKKTRRSDVVFEGELYEDDEAY